jgi:hypothetical protein
MPSFLLLETVLPVNVTFDDLLTQMPIPVVEQLRKTPEHGYLRGEIRRLKVVA